MALPDVADAAEWIGSQLVTASLRGGIAVGLVWLICRRIESISAATRTMLWWLASFTVLLALVPVPPLTLPLLPPTRSIDIDVSPSTPVVANDTSAAGDTGVVAGWLSPPRRVRQLWPAGVAALWLSVVGLQAVLLVSARSRLRHVVARSRAAGEAEMALAVRLARDIGLPSAPAVRVSDDIEGPQVVRFWRPVILLPAAVVLTSAELAMTLYHELAHVRRRDLALGWIPALAERLFFFHPLVRLAAREYVVAREAACDQAVLRALAVEPSIYARLLVRFGIAGSDSPLAAAGSATSPSFLRRRLAMLERVSSTGAGTRVVWCAVGAVIATSLPLKLVARTEPVAPPPAAMWSVDSAAQELQRQPARRVAHDELSTDEAALQPPVGRLRVELQDAERQTIEDSARQNRETAERDSGPTRQSLRALEQSTRRLAELEREKRLSQLQDELQKHAAERELSKVESLLDAMRRAAEMSAAPRVEANAAILDAIEAQARRLAEEAKQQPDTPALAERLRAEMESLRAQVARLEEQRETLVARQRALVAAQQRLSADVAKLSEILRQLEADRQR
jgi:beta-lactamase regulating signal transducer with metallopeptidase domain